METEEHLAGMGENPAALLALAERHVALAIDGVLFVMRIRFRHVVKADHRALVLHPLAEGVLPLAKIIVVGFSKIGLRDVFLENMEAAARPAREPGQIDQSLLLEQSCLDALAAVVFGDARA